MATYHLNAHHLIQLVSDITITCPPHIYNLVAPARASDPELTKKIELQTPAARGMFAPNLKYFQKFCPYSRVFLLFINCSANKDLFSLKKIDVVGCNLFFISVLKIERNNLETLQLPLWYLHDSNDVGCQRRQSTDDMYQTYYSSNLLDIVHDGSDEISVFSRCIILRWQP